MPGLMDISEESLRLIKATVSTGISTASNLNFYYLEPAVKTLIPVYHPALDRIPRYVPSINGQPVGGEGVHYKALTSIDSNGYPGIPEGNRAPFIDYTEEDYYTPYRDFGKDGFVTFKAEQAGLGLDDNIRLTQWSLLAALLNDIEREILYGNSGPNATNGGNGFGITTTPAPVLSDAGAVAGSTLPATPDYYKVCAIPLTGWGMRLAVGTTKITPTASRTTADGTTYTTNNGVGPMSALSNEIELTATGHGLKATITPVAGALGYAWYLSDVTSTGTEALSTAYFMGVTVGPEITMTTAPVNTNQAANDTGLNTDHSYSAYDTDGIITWIETSQGGDYPAYTKDLGGAGFTSNGDGSVKEIEDAMKTQFDNYKITYDEIWCAPDVIGPFSTAVLAGASSNAARINFFTDDAGRMTGGNLITEYRSRYSPNTGAKVLPVSMHPWLPNGTVLLVTIKNPYPEAANAIPSVLRIPTLLDFFSIKWPYRKLQHELGVYLIGALINYIPFAHGLLTSCV